MLFVLSNCNSSRQSQSRDSNTILIDGKRQKAFPASDSLTEILNDTSYFHNKKIKKEYIVPKNDSQKKVE